MDKDSRLHGLLVSQLKRLDLSAETPPDAEGWGHFLDEVDRAYRGGDEGTLILDENFDNLIAHAVDAFVLHDTKGNLLEINQATCEMLGYDREELLSMHVADFEMSLDPGAFWDDMTVDEVFTVEGTHRRKDGSTYPVETRCGAFMVDGEKIILALCRDITERKEAEAKLEALNARLELARDEAVHASKAKSTFLANMSHELRTPLNAVIGYSEFLIEEMEDAGDEDYVPDIERVLTAGRHLLSLINSILDLSKIEAGKTEIDITEFSLEQMATEIESTIGPLARKNHNAFVVEIDPNPPKMRSDVTKIRQVLFNLLSNACKFTENGEVRMKVVCDQETVGFEVSDTGVGMSEEELERIFEAFQQADASTTRKFGGTGLGLAITKHFCQMLGGSIDVQSTPGEGSTFRVILPVDLEDHGVEQHPAASPGVDPVSTEASTGGIVLVIEDDETARDLLGRTLRGEGYQVVTATNGSEGLHLARELDPLAITLDLLMPQMDGWSTLGELKRDEALCDIPVILVSMIDERQRGFALGADHYLVKPIERDNLISLVDGYTKSSNTGTCLIVEDDQPTRELVARILQKQGWQVMEAANGQQGFEAAVNETPELVILDLMMPEVDGFEFLSRFRADERFAKVPVVVVTAKELTTRERDELEQATSQIIHKAGRGPGELLAEVRRALRKLS